MPVTSVKINGCNDLFADSEPCIRSLGSSHWRRGTKHSKWLRSCIGRQRIWGRKYLLRIRSLGGFKTECKQSICFPIVTIFFVGREPEHKDCQQKVLFTKNLDREKQLIRSIFILIRVGVGVLFESQSTIYQYLTLNYATTLKKKFPRLPRLMLPLRICKSGRQPL